MARKFMFVCLGILALAVAYHLGAAKAESYTGSPFVSLCVFADNNLFVALTADGTLYYGGGYPQGADFKPAPFPQWRKWGQIPGQLPE